MKKVVCAQCGLVNLDKFVSFPHCAACGALLPQQAPPRWRRALRRPVKPIYWMLAVSSGLGLLGLAIASIARETRSIGDKPLLVYAQIPRDARAGQTVTAQFTLDSAQENADDSFERVSLRISRITQNQFVIVSVRPTPDSTSMRGTGRYYQWDELPRNSAIRLSISPRAGQQTRAQEPAILQLRATLWAAQYQQFEVRATIESAPRARAALGAVSAQKPMQKPPEVAR